VADLQQKVAEIEQKVLISSLEGRISSAPAVNFDASASNSSSILWVDDYPSNNAFLIDKFQRGGVDVTVALSTEDALKHFSNRNFSVVITDLGRREAGVEKKFAGLELIQRLRSINAKLPILVFAGERGLQNRDKLIAAGASDVTASGSDLISFVEQHASVGI
ncbi:MAG: response regulator, partial [Rhizobiaceae bacterium]